MNVEFEPRVDSEPSQSVSFRVCPVSRSHAPRVTVTPGYFPGSAALVEAFNKKFSTAPGVWSPYTYDSVKLLAETATKAGGFDAKPLTTALAATSGWKGWTGTVAFDATTGNRQPAPVTVNVADAQGAFHVDQSWVTATGFSF